METTGKLSGIQCFRKSTADFIPDISGYIHVLVFYFQNDCLIFDSNHSKMLKCSII